MKKNNQKFMSLESAKASVKYRRWCLASVHRLDKDGREIAVKNLEIAKSHLAFCESVQPIQLKLL